MNDNEEFIEKELKFIQDIKASNLYKTIKELSKKIDDNEELNNLIQKRDKILIQIDKCKNNEEKENLAKEYLKIEKEINSNELVIKYNDEALKLKRILNKFSSNINKVIL